MGLGGSGDCRLRVGVKGIWSKHKLNEELESDGLESPFKSFVSDAMKEGTSYGIPVSGVSLK